VFHSTLAKEVAVEVGDPISLSLIQQLIKLACSVSNILVSKLLCSKNDRKEDSDHDDEGERGQEWSKAIVAAGGGALFVGLVRLLGKVLNQTALISVSSSFMNTITVRPYLPFFNHIR
jgi:hypothetical protein